ncbi:MerR family transcriptional regulator [Tenacibaculum holothuriorum]|uniref:MerR family transcriptional regulator n=1 Tax=Tenacibaculum holothuriorum TaxID=1635173 RepID=UPI001E3BE08E|nr:MerR family transcriptional regulator [Tenacibaculum holothuriorum]
MLNNYIKTDFTIKDLENITGIKAHTIRIWEKRYNLLQPQRTSGNIRYYDDKSLQKLLNVALLNKNNLKISKIAQLSEDGIILKARELALRYAVNDEAINSLKMAMFQFNTSLFNLTYNQLLVRKSFKDVFKDVFIPFLEHIGLLWQTDTLTPAHEHFISNLIAQKIHLNIEKLALSEPTKTNTIFVLYLPENEVHELGLLYVNYELLLRGYKTIYLGQSVPLNNLGHLFKLHDHISFVTSFTIYPLDEKLDSYLKQAEELLANKEYDFYCLGRKVDLIDISKYSSDFKFFTSSIEMLNEL